MFVVGLACTPNCWVLMIVMSPLPSSMSADMETMLAVGLLADDPSMAYTVVGSTFGTVAAEDEAEEATTDPNDAGLADLRAWVSTPGASVVQAAAWALGSPDIDDSTDTISIKAVTHAKGFRCLALPFRRLQVNVPLLTVYTIIPLQK